MHVQFVVFGEIFNPTMAVMSRRYDDMGTCLPELFGLDAVALYTCHFVRRSRVNHPAPGYTAKIMGAFGIWIPHILTYRINNITEHVFISGISDNIAGLLIGNRLFYLPDDFYLPLFDDLIIKFHCMYVLYR